MDTQDTQDTQKRIDERRFRIFIDREIRRGKDPEDLKTELIRAIDNTKVGR